MSNETRSTSDIKPVRVTFKSRLLEDRSFLVGMIDDPVKTMRIYGYDADDRMVEMLQGMAANVRDRAVATFGEIVGRATATKLCEACDGCRVCKVCSSMTVPGDIRH